MMRYVYMLRVMSHAQYKIFLLRCDAKSYLYKEN